MTIDSTGVDDPVLRLASTTRSVASIHPTGVAFAAIGCVAIVPSAVTRKIPDPRRNPLVSC